MNRAYDILFDQTKTEGHRRDQDLLSSMNRTFLESLYQDYLTNPDSFPEKWRVYFNQLSNGDERTAARREKLQDSLPRKELQSKTAALQYQVDRLITSYRMRGHTAARIDPLDRPKDQLPELDPEFYGFTEAHLGDPYAHAAWGRTSLRKIIRSLKETYCRWIGAEFMHIDDLFVREWLQDRMEATQNRIQLSSAQKIRILTKLTDAVIFEQFLRTKFIGAKTFSLEGAESLLPLLDLVIETARQQDIVEIVIGMAHRGRLNVLANVIGKNPREIFLELADAAPESLRGGGDVQYHLGYSSNWKTSDGGEIHLSLCFNPSHVEFVNPVALGRIRAKQDRWGDQNREHGMALLIHGDAALAGEGIVQETLNLSQLAGYTTGGTLHVIVNNQIGFTTPPQEGRSSAYATDIAKMLQLPIFHVNGEHPEAVAQVVNLAMDFRKTFRRDAVIDMYCYRRHGHNESDEPSFTQPQLYSAIQKRKSVREGFVDHLVASTGVTREQALGIAHKRHEFLQASLSTARQGREPEKTRRPRGIWEGYLGGRDSDVPEVRTGVEKRRLQKLLEAQTTWPKDFHANTKIVRGMERRKEMAAGKRPMDWSSAEALAFASLVTEGYRVRLTGQDSARGTFSQRHAVLHDVEDGHTYVPLQNLSPDQAPVEIYNSPLSELGVLGFEYGYSLDCPDGLILWEAQFGDFCNAAQVIIDQFIASAEDKWHRLSGLVLLLPHGFEGMGPEHSSTRLERFLQLAAEDNMQIVYPTTPAQYFHCLRRQVLRPWRKPLVVLTPKSLLRNPRAVSTLDDCAEGSFQRILPDSAAPPGGALRRVILCAGKIYFDLEKRREELHRTGIALLRLEQLYPLTLGQVKAALAHVPEQTPVVWVQEEPENMGAWHYLRVRLGDRIFDHPFGGIFRASSASPATGSRKSHENEQQEIIAKALEEEEAG